MSKALLKKSMEILDKSEAKPIFTKDTSESNKQRNGKGKCNSCVFIPELELPTAK